MGITYTVLAQQSRNASDSGSSVSLKDSAGNLLVDPATTQPITSFDVYCPMNATDASTSGVTCRITCQASWDGGNTWVPITANGLLPYNWTGGVGPRGNYTVPTETNIPLPQNAQGEYADAINLVLDTRTNQLNVGMQATLHT